MGAFNHPDVFYMDDTTGFMQSDIFLSVFRTAYWNRQLKRQQGEVFCWTWYLQTTKLVKQLKVSESQGCLGCRDQDMMEFWIEISERQRKKKKKKKGPWIAPLSNRRAGFNLFRDLLGRIPYDKALEKNGPGKQVGYSRVTSFKQRKGPSWQEGNQAKGERRPVWMNKNLLIEVRHKKQVYTKQKQGQVTKG